MTGHGQIIIDLDRRRMQAMAKKDIATLDELIAEDLIYAHSTARLDTKTSLIDNMLSGKTVYTSCEPSKVVAQDLGNTVVLTGECQIKVSVDGTSRPLEAGAPVGRSSPVHHDRVATRPKHEHVACAEASPDRNHRGRRFVGQGERRHWLMRPN